MNDYCKDEMEAEAFDSMFIDDIPYSYERYDGNQEKKEIHAEMDSRRNNLS